MEPLAAALTETAAKVRPCSRCGNLDTADPCALCRDPRRDQGLVCVVEDVADLWAIERSAAYNGLYHVLGGTLSALDGVGPEDLRIEPLVKRVAEIKAREVILALNATVEGQTTAHYVMDRLVATGVPVSRTACRSAANSIISTKARSAPRSRRASRSSRKRYSPMRRGRDGASISSASPSIASSRRRTS